MGDSRADEVIEEFKRRMDAIDAEHDERLRQMKRGDRRFTWAIGLVAAGYLAAEILLAVLR